MKKFKWITSLFAFVFMSIICARFAGYNAERKYVEVSKGFSIPVSNYILLVKEADMDGDGKEDKIYVFGEKKNNETEYAEKINLAVVYAKNGFVKKTNVSHIKGYVYDVEICDFTGNKNKDVLLKTYTDEQKSIVSVFASDFGYDIPKNIMSDSRGTTPDFTFADGYVVNCRLTNGQNFSVNLENKKELLIKNGFFDESGQLKVNKKVYAKPFCDVKAIDYDNDSKSELAGVQIVVAGEKETELFKIHTVQKYSGSKWELAKIEVKY